MILDSALAGPPNGHPLIGATHQIIYDEYMGSESGLDRPQGASRRRH